MIGVDLPDLSRLATKLALPSKVDLMELRFGTVTAVATTASPITCSVTVQGESVAISGVRSIGSYRMRATDSVVMIKSGGDLFILGSLSTQTLVPGTIVAFAGNSGVSGYLPCDGASYLRTDYLQLFNVITTAWGSVDATHFNVPNFLGRSLLGAGAAGSGGLTARTHATTGGNETHTLASGELASHSHAISNVKFVVATTAHGHSGQQGFLAEAASTSTGAATASATDATAAGGAHNNMPPWAAIQYLIKT